MFASGLSKGFYERGEQRNRQRREIANAFNQFKQQNPEATLQDFQSFIDAQVGNGLGSNYLRGGAPSKEVLGSIADSNLRNKNRRIADETRKDIMAQGDLSGYLDGMMDKALLNANPDKLEDAKSTFLSGLSPEAQQAVTNSGTLNNWTESRYNFLQGQRMMTMLPQIDNYLKMKNYSLDEITPEKMASAFGIQTYEAQQFVDAAKRSMSLQMTEWWQNNNAGIQAAAEKAAKRPGATRKSIEESVKFQLQNSPLATNFLTEYKPLLDGLVTEAEELTKQREQALENEAAKRMINFEADVEANADLARLIANGDQKGALEKLMTIAKRRLNDEDFSKLFGAGEKQIKPSAFQDILDGRVGFLTDAQAQQYQKNYEVISGQTKELTSGFNEKNIGNLNAALKTGLADDMAGQLAYALGGEYYATSDLANKVFTAIRDMPEDVDKENQSAVVQYIKDTVGQTAIPLNQALAAQKGMLEERNGLYAPQGFGEFIRSESDQLITSMADMDSDYRDVLSKYGSDPAKLIAALNQLSQGINQFENGLASEMQARERNRLDWVKPNTGGYNPAVIKSEILDPAKAKIAAMAEMIQSTIKTATEKLNQQPEGLVPGRTVDDARADVSPVGGFVGDTVDSFGVTRDIANAINSANRGGPVGTLLTPIVGAGREIYENTMLSEAENERRDGVRSWVGSNEDRLNEFGTLAQKSQPEMYRKLLNDLSTMTADQIEEAYGYLLDKLAKDRKLPTQ
jgi:hypothetical protein